jgi:hypothetical protein
VLNFPVNEGEQDAALIVCKVVVLAHGAEAIVPPPMPPPQTAAPGGGGTTTRSYCAGKEKPPLRQPGHGVERGKVTG